MKYYNQLDCLRAIAVILVVISHWIPATNIVNFLPNGQIGVDIFFVLSGFLITKILFDNKEKAELDNVSSKTILKNFYVRRTLRIFPIYYLTIFALLAFHKATGTGIATAFPYFVTYTGNFYFFKIQAFDGMLSHLWSLAVEEQFYLIWPWLVLLLNRKYLLPLIFSFILIGIASQCLLFSVKLSGVLTFTCFDAFGLGALLAWQITYGQKNINRFYTGTKVLAAIAAVLFLIVLAMKWNLPSRTAISLMALWLISFIVIKQDSNLVKSNVILNNKVLLFIGKISYGVYLYHNIVPAINSHTVNIYLNPLLPDIIFKKYWGQLFLVENIVLTGLISWISYVIIEKPFLSLKKYFNYQSENRVQKVVPSEV